MEWTPFVEDIDLYIGTSIVIVALVVFAYKSRYFAKNVSQSKFCFVACLISAALLTGVLLSVIEQDYILATSPSIQEELIGNELEKVQAKALAGHLMNIRERYESNVWKLKSIMNRHGMSYEDVGMNEDDLNIIIISTEELPSLKLRRTW